MAKRENEEGVWEEPSEQRGNQDIARMRVTKGATAFLLGRPVHEVDRMSLNLFDVLAEVGLPAVWNEARQGAAQLDGKGPEG